LRYFSNNNLIKTVRGNTTTKFVVSSLPFPSLPMFTFSEVLAHTLSYFSNILGFPLPRLFISFHIIYIQYFFPLAPLLESSLPYWSTGLITQFLDLSQAIGVLGRVISSSQGLYLNTGQHKHKKNADTQTSMPRAGFEPAITASEPSKTVHAPDRSVTATGILGL
jgi:hypothetical protein